MRPDVVLQRPQILQQKCTQCALWCSEKLSVCQCSFGYSAYTACQVSQPAVSWVVYIPSYNTLALWMVLVMVSCIDCPKQCTDTQQATLAFAHTVLPCSVPFNLEASQPKMAHATWQQIGAM